jgi:hypothetical protein
MLKERIAGSAELDTGHAFTREEVGQLIVLARAMAFALFAVCAASLLATRVPALRERLRSGNWRMRVAVGAFMGAYNLQTRRSKRVGDGA